MATSTMGRMALVAAILSSSAILLRLKRRRKRKRARSVLARQVTRNTEAKTVLHNVKEELRLEDHSYGLLPSVSATQVTTNTDAKTVLHNVKEELRLEDHSYGRVPSVSARQVTTNTEAKTVLHNVKEVLRLEDHSYGRVPSASARQITTNTKTKTVLHNPREELRLEDHSHEDFLGMSKDNFQELLQLVAPFIAKADTNMRKAVSPDQRLAVTLRYLVTGESRRSLASHFQISHNLISNIIPSVCRAIYQVLQPLYLRVPNTEQEWQTIGNQFLIKRNFPHCIGAIDGRRVITAKPPMNALEHNNFIMFVLVDADYKFIFAEVGSFITASDSELWDTCSLQEALEADMLNIPKPALLPFSNTQCPYVMVSNDAFPLKPYVMKPYPDKALSVDEKIFNSRLSCARVVSENALGILFRKFGIFSQPICISSENVQDVILCTIVLHNFLCTKIGDRVELADWNDSLKNTPHPAVETLCVCEKTSSSDAEAVRDKLRDFFVNEGQLS